jgi:ABC-type transport system involved in multi-copper enzyme maturation permease subunit
MLFSLGPVVRYELITTARRGRLYIVRVLYGLCLLVQLGYLFADWDGLRQGGATMKQLQAFAEDAFLRFAGLQGLALMLLIPALVSGVIADEHQRMTLHYLLASRLSSAEIVLGKMGARLVHVGSFVALGLPVVSLLMLYGGINPMNILYVYSGTLSVTILVAGISIFISILARRPREAMLSAYALEGLWLYVSLAIAPYSKALDWPLGWVEPVNDVVLMSNPIPLWYQATSFTSTKIVWVERAWLAGRVSSFWAWDGGFEWEFAKMAVLQVGFGLLFLGLAIAGLRPLRGSSWPGCEPRAGWWTRLQARYRSVADARAARALARNELLRERAQRPACGENPMLWKERYTRLGGGLRWLSSRPVALFFSVLLGCILFDVGAPVAYDLLRGQWSQRSWSAMNDVIRATSAALALLGMLAVAAASATSLTGEREQDTWTSLATTLLNPGEIIRAKQFGALWSAYWVGLALLISWGTGLLMGAIHPLGALTAIAIVASTGWLVAAAGVFVSSLAKNSTRALAFTFILLVSLVVVSRSPWSLWLSLVSYQDLHYLWEGGTAPGYNRLTATRADILLLFVTPVLQSILAAILTLLATIRLRSTWVAN